MHARAGAAYHILTTGNGHGFQTFDEASRQGTVAGKFLCFDGWTDDLVGLLTVDGTFEIGD